MDGDVSEPRMEFETRNETNKANLTSESYPRRCEATKAVAKKVQKRFWGFRRRTRCDALPTELWSLAGSKWRVSSICTRYVKIVRCVYDTDKSYILCTVDREQVKAILAVMKQLKLNLHWSTTQGVGEGSYTGGDHTQGGGGAICAFSTMRIPD